MAVRPLRLLQFSDLHLGAPGYAASLGLGEESPADLAADLKAVLARLADLARDRRVDAILVPGDLFDDEAVDAETVDLAATTFAALDPTPIIVSPGNHDPYRHDGYYGPVLLGARGRSRWPENVILFRSEAWTTVRVPGRPEATVTGCAYLRPTLVEERRLGEPIARDESEIAVLLVHGSRDGFAAPGKRITLPFSEEELLAQGFAYAALGHYHDRSEVLDPRGAIRGAYAGCPQGRGLDETGLKGALLLSVGPEGAEDVEFVPTAERVVHRVPVDVGRVADGAAVLRAVEQAVRMSEAGARDLVVAEVEGRLAPGRELAVPAGFLAGRVGHVRIRWEGLRPDYDLEGYRSGDAPPTTETRFARRMLEAIESVGDPEEADHLREALDLGLDALHGHPLRKP